MSTVMENLEEDNTQVEVSDNTSESKFDSIISLTTGEISSSSTKGKKGRPVLHPFAGRITLLREEVLDVLNNPIKFALLMEEEHSIPEDRAEVIAEYLDENTMDYTYCGPIANVINEILSKVDEYKENDKVASVRVDIKKKKIVTDIKNPLYLHPEVDGKIVKKIEAYPNKIYGFVKIKFK